MFSVFFIIIIVIIILQSISTTLSVWFCYGICEKTKKHKKRDEKFSFVDAAGCAVELLMFCSCECRKITSEMEEKIIKTFMSLFVLLCDV